jgi:hypothetical protein
MDFFEQFKKIDDDHKKMDNEIKRLMAEPPKETPKIGDRVIVAVGLLNRGHLWIREEAKVIEVAEHSVKIECQQYKHSDPWQEWIHPALITDNLGKEKRKLNKKYQIFV